jgi:orotate phosphoribosyltransferase
MNQVIDILKKVGAVLPDSHFVGTSGVHFDTYINKDALLLHTESVSEICKMFAEKYKGQEIDIVVSPAVAGIPLSQWTAYHLTKLTGKEVLSAFTEKTSENDQIFKRGYENYVKGKKVLILEDSTQTGSSVVKVIKSVQDAGGNIVGVGVIVNKDPEKINTALFGVPFASLAELPVQPFPAENCPLCKNNIPINTTVGHGKKFLESKK